MRYNSRKRLKAGVHMQIINEPDQALAQAVQGIQWTYPELAWVPDTYGCYDRHFADNQIPLLAGGGSGHAPAHWGYVGHGMLTGAVMGTIFTPPTAEQIVKVAQAMTHQRRLFLIVKNFSADVKAFKTAQTTLQDQGWDVGMALVADDISVDNASLKQRRRGVAGTVLIHKLLGAAAANGATMAELTTLAQHVTAATKTIGVATSGALIPGQADASFTLNPGEIYYGIGIHGEPGYRQEPFQSSERLAQELISKLRLNFQWHAHDHYAVLVNSLGGITPLELMVFNHDVHELLQLDQLALDFHQAGTFLTSNGMHGLSLTLLHLEQTDWLAALNMPVKTPAWPNH